MFMFTNGGRVQVFDRDGLKGIVSAKGRDQAERFVTTTAGEGASIIEVCDGCNCEFEIESIEGNDVLLSVHPKADRASLFEAVAAERYVRTAKGQAALDLAGAGE